MPSAPPPRSAQSLSISLLESLLEVVPWPSDDYSGRLPFEAHGLVSSVEGSSGQLTVFASWNGVVVLEFNRLLLGVIWMHGGSSELPGWVCLFTGARGHPGLQNKAA